MLNLQMMKAGACHDDNKYDTVRQYLNIVHYKIGVKMEVK